MVLTGMEMVGEVKYVTEKGVMNAGRCQVLGADGKLISPMASGVITQTPHAIISDTAHMVTGITTITGTITPVGRRVNVSLTPNNQEYWYDLLVENTKFTTLADESGAFEFVIEHDGENEDVTVWSELDTDFYTATYAEMTMSATYDTVSEPMLAKGFFSFRMAEDNESIEPMALMTLSDEPETEEGSENEEDFSIEYTLYGTCPADAQEIYISAPESQYSDDQTMLEELQATLVTQITADNGHYQQTWDYNPFEAERQYCVWCQSVLSSNVVATFTSENGEADGGCLAGNVLILLHDGTEKPISELNMNDLLMSGSGEPTSIAKIERGELSTFHTLYYFSDGSVIDEAHRHRFFNVEAGYWKYLDEWQIGDRAKHVNGCEPRLQKIEIIKEPCRRYGLWTESRDYFAGGLLSGEMAANQDLTPELSLEQMAEILSSLSTEKLVRLYEGVYE